VSSRFALVAWVIVLLAAERPLALAHDPEPVSRRLHSSPAPPPGFHILPLQPDRTRPADPRLTARQIADVIRANRATLTSCWALLPTPAAAGLRVYAGVVIRSGVVQSADIYTQVPEDVRLCLDDALRRWHFPRLDGRFPLTVIPDS
jgi:hypothetical protein